MNCATPFRRIEECSELTTEPWWVEYLKCKTMETFCHIFGTEYWDDEMQAMRLADLKASGITHFRILKSSP